MNKSAFLHVEFFFFFSLFLLCCGEVFFIFCNFVFEFQSTLRRAECASANAKCRTIYNICNKIKFKWFQFFFSTTTSSSRAILTSVTPKHAPQIDTHSTVNRSGNRCGGAMNNIATCSATTTTHTTTTMIDDTIDVVGVELVDGHASNRKSAPRPKYAAAVSSLMNNCFFFKKKAKQMRKHAWSLFFLLQIFKHKLLQQ